MTEIPNSYQKPTLCKECNHTWTEHVGLNCQKCFKRCKFFGDERDD